MALQIQTRRDTAANWIAQNPTLAEGEFGVEVESLLAPPIKYKVGDGLRNWQNLPYATNNPKTEGFSATQGQTSYVVPEGEIADDKFSEVKVNGTVWNSRTGQINFTQGNISIDFSTGEITFHVALDAGDQVVVKYN